MAQAFTVCDKGVYHPPTGRLGRGVRSRELPLVQECIQSTFPGNISLSNETMHRLCAQRALLDTALELFAVTRVSSYIHALIYLQPTVLIIRNVVVLLRCRATVN